MKNDSASDMNNEATSAELFRGDGDVLATLRGIDWAGTLLGPVNEWATELRGAIQICLHSRFPMAVLWGTDFVYLYNDAASVLSSDKHRWALGRVLAEVWPEIWATVGPTLQEVLVSGKATFSEDLLMLIERNGGCEECYLTFSYSPIFVADGSVGGIFVTFVENTRRVVSERRQRSISDLATQVALHTRDDELLGFVKKALERNPIDVPLAALVVTHSDGRHELAFSTGLDALLLPETAAALEGCAACCLKSGQTEIVDDAMLVDVLAVDPSLVPLRQLVAIPLWRGGEDAPYAAILLGASPHCRFDADYSGFFKSVAGHIAHAVALVESEASEARRMATKVKVEQNRMQFFGSVSHELHTPLTLVLGPLKMTLEQQATALPEALRKSLEMAYRNALRLHKVISSMRDITSIETGSLLPVLDLVDPFTSTTEIVSLFRSAIEEAGLRLEVRSTGPLAELTLDREMWETIVANLVSNALKYTEAGCIEVSLERCGDCLVLVVADTGIGIASEEFERIFERFYRSANLASRRSDGSGVGLALVQELVRLLGGEVSVESALGAGSRFTVALPWREPGAALPCSSGALCSMSVRSDSAAELECLRPNKAAKTPPNQTHPVDPIHVVIIGDDRDLVAYIERLLESTCAVTCAHDAERGMAAIRTTSPDLVIVDLMMPGINGLELVRQIRANPPIHTVPLLVLSARDSEGARLEALKAGADDYVTKPFSAHELVARVRRAAVEQEGELRRQIDAVKGDLESVLEGTSDSFVRLDRNLRIRSINGAALAILRCDRAAAVGKALAELAPGLLGSDFERALRVAIDEGGVSALEYRMPEGGCWYDVRCYPAPHGVLIFANDITARKQAERALLEAHVQLEQRVALRTAELSAANDLLVAVFDRAPSGIVITCMDERVVRVNHAYALLAGETEKAFQGRTLDEWIQPADMEQLRGGHRALLAGRCDSFQAEVRYLLPDKGQLRVAHSVSLIGPAWNNEQCFVTIASDITERQQVETDRQASGRMLQSLYEQLQTVREAERAALAREVHDQLGQILSAAKIDIKLLEDDLRAHRGMSNQEIIAELNSASRTLEHAIKLVRHIATELRAPELDERGLYGAVAWHARDFERRTRIPCHLDFGPRAPHLSRSAALALLRIFQEAATNVLRHARATQIWVSLETRGAALLMRVRDDGIGIDTRRAKGSDGLGLQGMHERAELEGGTLLVSRLCPRGTLVSVHMPLQDINVDKHD